MNIIKNPVRLSATAKAVILQYLRLPGNDRIRNVVRRVVALPEEQVDLLLEELMKDFNARHRNLKAIFLDHFSEAEIAYGESLSHFQMSRKYLLGAFFTKEYSIEAAALFNPSIISHPDQQGVKPGEQRFLMSLRATGEGHISSIVFQTGVVDRQNNILLDEAGPYHTCLRRKGDTKYTKQYILDRAAAFPRTNKTMIDKLPAEFTVAQAMRILRSKDLQESGPENSISMLESIFDGNYDLESPAEIPINEKVIFPGSKAESMGMEDVRLVRFGHSGRIIYYGTYTAYNGKEIQTRLLETEDFNSFSIRTLTGSAVQDKGMALFPEKINGQYVMVSRQGGEKINIMFSDDLYTWDKFKTLMEPRFDWELLQLGNCGSPIKTRQGWLLLTHGVGAMRVYVISAILLDLEDPSRIIGRLNKPLVRADESEREGYVPNVVYTCGLMLHGETLIIPYALSDSYTGFLSVRLDELLNEMESASGQ